MKVKNLESMLNCSSLPSGTVRRGGVISENYMTPNEGESSIGAVTNNKGGKMGKKDGEVSPYEQGIVLLVVLIAITLIMVWLAQ